MSEYSVHRRNAHGHLYTLMAIDETQTQITRSDKKIVVKHNIDKLNRSWYQWTQGEMLIQNAFPYLTPDEREFLITGITKEEWAELFGRDE